MMTTRPPLKTQRGTVLLVSLVILLLMTMLAITAVSTSSLQERMAFNSQQNNSAFQAAESGLDTTIALIVDRNAPAVDRTINICKAATACPDTKSASEISSRVRIATASRIEDGFDIKDGTGSPAVTTYDMTSSATLDPTPGVAITDANINARHIQGFMTVEIR